jgi:hypothetical protein
MKDDGGPAFPAQFVTAQNTVELQAGMTLRDWFGGMALQGLIAGCYAGNNIGFTVDGNVCAAYEYADAMIAARKK